MDSHKKLLLANKAWVQDKLNVDPSFFQKTSREQTPDYLWIGCSDSRVPAEDITGVEPGEIFVHRNVANLVIHTDFNVHSVLQYAVEVLKVKHVIVCGHYGCGGVKNALGHQDLGLINKWLHHIKDVYRLHADELDAVGDFEQRFQRLVEINVLEQVQNIAQSSMIQRAWKEHQRPYIHGWVYDLKTGYLKDLAMMTPQSHVGNIYTFEFPV